MSDKGQVEAVSKRAVEYARRYPWRLYPGAKDYLARDRETLLRYIEHLERELAEGKQ